MDFKVLAVIESSCPCLADHWNFESCPVFKACALASNMPGPSTSQSLSSLLKMTQECSVALQRLEDMVPGFRYKRRSMRALARKERRLRTVTCTNGTGAAATSTDDCIRDAVHRELRRSRGDEHHVVKRGWGYTVYRKDLKTVLGTDWVNDVVIDFYMGLITERAAENPEGLRVHAVTAHFFSVLRNRGYEAVRRWTDSVDLFSFDLLLVPIHDLDHWSLAVLNITNRSFDFYDSMGRKNWNCYQILMAYLRKEHKDKRKSPLVPDGKWDCQYVKGIPQQTNNHDCGVFVCLYAECLSRGAPFNFTAKDIQQLRYRIAYEIISGKLMEH